MTSFNHQTLSAHGFTCCGKPAGCDMTHDGCAYLQHPWKRAFLFDDPTVQCQARVWPDPHKPGRVQCTLLNGHDGLCEFA